MITPSLPTPLADQVTGSRPPRPTWDPRLRPRTALDADPRSSGAFAPNGSGRAGQAPWQHRLRRSAAIATAAAIGAAACKDIEPQYPPTPPKPGPAPDTRICVDGSGKYGRDGGVRVVVAQSYQKCPIYSLARDTTTVDWAVASSVPVSSAASAATTPGVYATIVDTYRGVRFAETVPGQIMALDPNNPAQYVLTIRFLGTQPGRYRNTAAGHVNETRDSAFAQMGGLKTQYLPAYAYSVRPGRVDAFAPYVTGSRTVRAGDDDTWWVATDGNPASYQFAWSVDGVPVANTGSTLTRSFTAGSHVLRATTTRFDGSSTVSTAVVTATAGCGGGMC